MLDFLPEYSVDEVKILLKERANRQPEKTAKQFFTGLFHEKLAAVWLKFAKIKKEKLCGDFTDADIQRLAWMIKEFKSPCLLYTSHLRFCKSARPHRIQRFSGDAATDPLYFTGSAGTAFKRDL